MLWRRLSWSWGGGGDSSYAQFEKSVRSPWELPMKPSNMEIWSSRRRPRPSSNFPQSTWKSKLWDWMRSPGEGSKGPSKPWEISAEVRKGRKSQRETERGAGGG